MINKSLCSYPWIGSTIRPDGRLAPCPRYANHNKDITINNLDPRNSDDWIELRNKMLLGEKISNCEKCYKDEENNKESMRQYSLKHYIPTNQSISSLVQLEIAFNNLCNLACVQCNSYFSSRWYNENFKKGKLEKVGVLENNFSFEKWDLSQLRQLKIIGGEPLMSQDRFIDLLKRVNLLQLNLLMVSNGTILPKDELKNLLENSKHLSISISLDGIGSVNDWIRWPSNFNQIVKNLHVYNNWFKNNSNVTLKVHCVINVYNVLYLEDLMLYMQTNFPNWEISWDWLSITSWQSICVLPTSIKDKLIEDFTIADRNYSNLPNPFRITINRLQDINNSSWKEFKKNTIELSKDRNLNFLEMVDRFVPFWELP